MGLANYKDVIAITVTISTLLNMFSGVPVCLDIYNKKNAEKKDPILFIGGIGMGSLMLVLGKILENEPGIYVIMYCTIFGMIMNILYCIVFWIYTPNKKKLVTKIVIVTIVTIVLLSYAYFEDNFSLKLRWGVILIIVSVVLSAAPLLNLNEIKSTKNSDILPFPMILMGTLVTVQWILYGISVNNNVIIIHNMAIFIPQLLELLLFVRYPSIKDELELKKDEPSEANSDEKLSESDKDKESLELEKNDPSKAHSDELLQSKKQEAIQLKQDEKLSESNKDKKSLEANSDEKLSESDKDKESLELEKNDPSKAHSDELLQSKKQEAIQLKQDEKLSESNKDKKSLELEKDEPSEANSDKKLESTKYKLRQRKIKK